ncbi:MAG TPA: hypothetical protein EYP08_01290 [Pyrodictiaceae archaeon]|nr:hypothetical protein [Pyrodictiaceae archaeon]HIQ55938.1 hypothetical protein [Pyrodictium sp.]
MNIRLVVGVAILVVVVCIAMLVSLNGLLGAVEILSSSTIYSGEFNVSVKILRVGNYYNVTLYIDGVLRGVENIGFQRYTMKAVDNSFFYNSSWSITYPRKFDEEKRTLIYTEDHGIIVHIYSRDRLVKLVNATFIGTETVNGTEYYVYRVAVSVWGKAIPIKPLVTLQPPPSLAPGLATPAYTLAELLSTSLRGNGTAIVRTHCIVDEGYGVEELKRSINGTSSFHHRMYFRLSCREALPYAFLQFYAFTQKDNLYYQVRAEYLASSTTQLATYLDDLAKLGKLNVSVDFDGRRFYNEEALNLLRNLG